MVALEFRIRKKGFVLFGESIFKNVYCILDMNNFNESSLLSIVRLCMPLLNFFFYVIV